MQIILKLERNNSMTKKDNERNPKIVYICSPYRGKSKLDQEQNVLNAKRYGRFALESGYSPIITHLSIAEITDDSNEDERNLGIAADMELLKVCSEIWVFGQPSEGMVLEIQEACRLEINIRWFEEKSCLEFSDEIVGQFIRKYVLPIPPRI